MDMDEACITESVITLSALIDSNQHWLNVPYL